MTQQDTGAFMVRAGAGATNVVAVREPNELTGTAAARSGRINPALGEHFNPFARRSDVASLMEKPWRFSWDAGDKGLKEGWHLPENARRELSRSIRVPIAPEEAASGINEPEHTENVSWYSREFKVPADWDGKRVLLHMDQVDRNSTVWIDGKRVGSHEGGYAPATYDLTEFARPGGKHTIVVRCFDDNDRHYHLGKQLKERGMFFKRSSGIRDNVWLEGVPKTSIDNLRFTADHNTLTTRVSARVDGAEDGKTYQARVRVLDGDKVLGQAKATVQNGELAVNVATPSAKKWSPLDPNMYSLEVELLDEKGSRLDKLGSCLTFATFEVRRGAQDKRVLHLNGEEMVGFGYLDQGQYRDTGLTPPSVDDIRLRVQRHRELGATVVRNHCFVPNKQLLFEQLRRGLAPSLETPNAFSFSPDSFESNQNEWKEIVEVNRNIPFWSVIARNEDWGFIVREKEFISDKRDYDDPRNFTPERNKARSDALKLTRQLRPNGPVIDDAWHMLSRRAVGAHDYTTKPEDALALFENGIPERAWTGARLMLPGVTADPDAALFLTECLGAQTLAPGEKPGMGYKSLELSEHIPWTEAMLGAYAQISQEKHPISAIVVTQFHNGHAGKEFPGESNGYVEFDKDLTPKHDPEVVAAAVERALGGLGYERPNPNDGWIGVG